MEAIGTKVNQQHPLIKVQRQNNKSIINLRLLASTVGSILLISISVDLYGKTSME